MSERIDAAATLRQQQQVAAMSGTSRRPLGGFAVAQLLCQDWVRCLAFSMHVISASSFPDCSAAGVGSDVQQRRTKMSHSEATNFFLMEARGLA